MKAGGRGRWRWAAGWVLALAALQCAGPSIAGTVVNVWSSNGPDVGLVHSLAIDPNVSSPFYVATAGATLTVDSTDDAPDANPSDGVCATAAGRCTLRAAIQSAHDGDQILLPSGTYALVLGVLDIEVGLTLRGAGMMTTRIDGGGKSAVINIGNTTVGITVSISDVSIQNGGGVGAAISNNGDTQLTNVVVSGNKQEGAGGGGISNGGRLLLANSTITDNSLFDDGGPAFGAGLSNDGEATLTNVTLSGNMADGRESTGGAGGALFNGGSATLTLSHVTVSDNAANIAGGGIWNEGTLTLSDSTLSGNRSGGTGGGGLFNDRGSATLSNVTISGNSAAEGSGLYNRGQASLTNVTLTSNSVTGGPVGNAQRGGIFNEPSGSALLRNTIVAKSSSVDGGALVPGLNCSGTITDGGHNLDDGTSCGFSKANGSLSNTDPKLDPAGLADNGGPTQTIALEMDSPAINAGDERVCGDAPVNGVDQRGYIRPGTGATNCSIGAYEYDSPGPPLGCVGDCDGNGAVAIHELILGVNIVLDNQPSTACPAFENTEGEVNIAQLTRGVNNALNGCSPQTAALRWFPGCGPPVVGRNACPASVQFCTATEQLGGSCAQAESTCCQPGSDCTDALCNLPLVCSTKSPATCPI
jgi:CSLREA domain-containing protein